MLFSATMSHRIEAFVGLGSRLRFAFRYCAPLRGDLVLVSITEVPAQLPGEQPISPFHKLTPRALAAARECVPSDTPFGYVETEYFGGVGEQCGAVWFGGGVLVAPQQADRIVNTVLRTLGVVRALGKDEWDTVDLARYRSTDDIVSAARVNVR